MQERHDSSLAELSRLRYEVSLDENLRQVAELALRMVTGCDLAGITLLRAGRPITAAFTDVDAPDIDAAQYETGSGPCLSAFNQNEVLRIADTRTDRRWPDFAAACVEHGVLSTLSLPLTVATEALGALNLYSNEEQQFTDADAATVFSSQAAVVLANAQAYWAAQHLALELEKAMQTRSVIEQAKGIIIGRDGCDPDTAFDTLRIASQTENRKLRDIARDLVDESIRLDPQP